MLADIVNVVFDRSIDHGEQAADQKVLVDVQGCPSLHVPKQVIESRTGALPSALEKREHEVRFVQPGATGIDSNEYLQDFVDVPRGGCISGVLVDYLNRDQILLPHDTP